MGDHPNPDEFFRANSKIARASLEKLASELRTEDQHDRAAVCESASRVIDTTSRGYMLATEEIRRLSSIEDPFWMVCRKPGRPDAKTEPKRRFPHIKAAREEARRLACALGVPFVILVAIEEIAPQENKSGRLPL